MNNFPNFIHLNIGYDSSSPSSSKKHKPYPEAYLKRSEILKSNQNRRNSNSDTTTTPTISSNHDDETSNESFSDKSLRKLLSPEEMENLAAQDGRFLISAEKLGPILSLEKMSLNDQEKEYNSYLNYSELPDV